MSGTQIEISKTFKFEAAHQLPGYDGKCARLHGHSYRFEVRLAGCREESGPKRGMVHDFADLSSTVKERIISCLDHRFISSGEEPYVKWLRGTSGGREQLETEGITHIGKPTTAENLAEYIGENLRCVGLPVVRVRLWETASSYADWIYLDSA